MEEGNKKKKKTLTVLLIVFASLAVMAALGFWLLCELFKMTTFAKVDSRNSLAQNYLKAVSTQVEEVYKEKGEKIPADKEYIIRGYGATNEPCELLSESITSQYLPARSRYWVVSFKYGKAYEVWASKRPIKDSELRYYSRSELIDESKEHPIRQDELMLGYYNLAEGSTYVD